VALATLALVAAQPAAAADLSAARRLSLDNGLTVLTLYDPSHPVVAVQMLYRAGARNETTGITGIAHYVEHMLFRGTKSFGLADVTGVIERAGGEWHGYTYLDQTTYFEAAPRDLLLTLLRLEAERMTAARMAPEEVAPERGAVFQELRGYQNDARTILFDEAMATLFLQHPYRNNTMGWESDLAGITHQDLVTFYRRYYGPRNAVLAIAGDFDPASIEAQVRAVFGAIPAGGESTEIRTVEPPPSGPRRITVRRAGAAASLMVSFLAPPPSRPRDYAALMVLDAILSRARGLSFRGGENDQTGGAAADPESRLGRALASSAATRFGTAFVPTEYPYHYTIYAVPKPGRAVDEISPAIFRVLAEAGQAVGRDEIASARRRIEANLLLEVDSPVDLAHELAFWTGLGGLDLRRGVVEALGAIGPDEVSRLARRFTPEAATVGILLPEGPGPGTAPRGDAAGPEEVEAAAPAPAAAAPAATAPPLPTAGRARPAPRRAEAAGVETLALGPQTRAIVDVRPGQRTFVLRAAAAHGGAGAGGVAAAGLLRGMAIALQQDAATRAALIDLGVRLSVQGPDDGPFAERHSFQVSLAGPDETLDPAVRLLAPALARALQARQPAQETKSLDPETRALQVLAAAATAVEARPAAADTPPAARLAEPGAPSISIALVSPYAATSVRDLLRILAPAGKPTAPERKSGGGGAPLAAGRRVEMIPAIAQGRLLIAIPGGDDAEALGALAYVLHHSYSGRLGVKAIAEMGLVYSMESEAVTRGRPLAYFTMGAEPQSLARLEAAMLEVLDRAAATLTEQEVVEYRSFVAGDLPVRLSDPQKAARLWCSALLRGEDHTGPRRAVDRARGLTRERVAAMARAALDPARRLTVVVTREATAGGT
jgi:zinc protease